MDGHRRAVGQDNAHIASQRDIVSKCDAVGLSVALGRIADVPRGLAVTAEFRLRAVEDIGVGSTLLLTYWLGRVDISDLHRYRGEDGLAAGRSVEGDDVVSVSFIVSEDLGGVDHRRRI